MVNRAMSVSERPARHRPPEADSGEAGGRYLEDNSTVFCSGQIFGVCSTKPLGICKWSVKAQIFDQLSSVI